MKTTTLVFFILATFVALLTGFVLPVEASVAARAVTLLSAATVVSLGRVLAAPVPDVAAIAAKAVVTGLPPCAEPVINKLLTSNADLNFGCGEGRNLNIACLCTSKQFKKDAKRGILNACPSAADEFIARQWAIARCNSAFLVVNRLAAAAGSWEALDAPTGSVPNDTDFGTPTGVNLTGPTGNSTRGIPMLVFEIDDDEDETSAAGVARPIAGLSLMAAMGAAMMLL
ncbi:hypothetical protein C8A00DRAFT_34615 [Chaetomidium leptoderma]|uniref:Extracellular membrane protein CFEM domain-containing protein n=1 Tax=Chaetomidium leptoderma TaxID=669021 RepID=A0AAN6VK23_9PEZI|nr:hypothetical protein C8A00DRAFT_34615 [Chaetomidium leptoderma]